jgi:hypothetical protein
MRSPTTSTFFEAAASSAFATSFALKRLRSVSM